MKLRIIEKDGLFTPQYYHTSLYYRTSFWNTFSCNNKPIKFKSKQFACDFIDLIGETVIKTKKKKNTFKTIYSYDTEKIDLNDDKGE